MKISYVSCFCTDKFPSGNPAAIVEEFTAGDSDKQALATQLNLPVTVFVTKTNRKFLFRFFYPAREMPLCLHGALAAAYVLMGQKGLTELHATTNEQKELVFTKTASDTVHLTLECGKILPFENSTQDLDKMLGIVSDNVLDKTLPYCVATIGSPKLLVPLMTYETIATLKPDFSFIKEWSLKNNINGLYIYTKDTRAKNIDFIARGFNPKGGSNEDAATGVAASALYTALGYADKRKVCIHQGEFIYQPSQIIVAGNKNKLFIGAKVYLHKN